MLQDCIGDPRAEALCHDSASEESLVKLQVEEIKPKFADIYMTYAC